MKILYVTTVGITMVFFKQFIKSLLNDGHTVDIATNEAELKLPECYREWNCTIHHIDSSRSPFNKGNLSAIKQLKNLVTKEKYDIVHCHSPIAAMCTRLACRGVRKQGTKVFYTAHGFHFYKGAPKKNWFVYYPIEKICSYFTDTLITINQEDYELARKKMRAKHTEYIPGVGIDFEKFNGAVVDRVKKRLELGVPHDATLLLSVGELNGNKNHETVIRAIADMDVYYIIAGTGDLHDKLQGIIDDLGMKNRVKLLGYRNDVAELCKTSDIFVFPSFREGLPVSVMEAMAGGLPVVCSNIRGNKDLIDEKGGALFRPDSVSDCRRALEDIMNKERFSDYGAYNTDKVKKLDFSIIRKRLLELYCTQ